MQRIFLIGFRGSGKSTLARLVANKLGWSWCDADEVLERRYGKTVREIFAAEGEAAFRDKEAEVLGELCSRSRQVIATGGGVILREENRHRLRQAGWVVWLKAPADVLWQRLREDATTPQRRPNLSGGGLAEVQEILRVREPLYAACAHYQVETVGKTPEEIAETILARALAEFPPP